MNSETCIVIADDHAIFRQGLRQVIEQAGFRVVAEEADGEAALDRIRHLRPEIAVLDIDMPVRDGFSVTRLVQQERIPVEIIFLTMHKDELHLEEALQLGVKGYVVKDGAAAEVVSCIRAVRAGETHISPALSALLLNRTRRASGFAQEQPAVKALTPTERRILALLVDCKTSRDIASELGVSTRTIETHRVNICDKLNLKGTHALVKFAMQHKAELV